MNGTLPPLHAALVAAFTFVVGLLVSLVPSIAEWQASIIAIGSAVLGVVFMVVNAIHDHNDAKVEVAQTLVPPEPPKLTAVK